MIQSTPVRAVMGRDDAVVWPLTAVNELFSPSGVTRMVLICTKDGETDVVIDSLTVPAAYDFTSPTTVRGKLVNAVRWLPGLAIGSQFTETGIWKARVFLYDAVHTEGVDLGQFLLDVRFVELPPPPVLGGPVTHISAATDLFSPAAASTMNLTMVNSLIDTDTYPDAVVVLTIAGSTTATVPTAVTIGGVAASLLTKQASPAGSSDRTIAVAMARVPTGGFVSPTITITWPSIGTPTVKATADVYYNVDPTSDAFALGHTEVSRYGTASEYGSGDAPYFNITAGTLSSRVGFAATGYPTGQFGFLEGGVTSGNSDYKGYALGALYMQGGTLVLGLNGAPANLTFDFVLDVDQMGSYRRFNAADATVTFSSPWRIWTWTLSGSDPVMTDSFTTELFGGTISALSAPGDGAVVVGVMGGTSDGGPIILSSADFTSYQMTSRISAGGPRYRSAWRLFAAPASERVVNIGNAVYPTDTIIAFVLAGTG